MPHYVYIIYSATSDLFYKGESAQPLKRLEQHNNNLSAFTAGKGAWELVYIEELENRTDALKKEKMLKRQNRKYLEWLIQQPQNLLNK